MRRDSATLHASHAVGVHYMGLKNKSIKRII